MAALIGLGSNLGDRSRTLSEALAALALLGGSLRASHLYETAPWGVRDQPRFLNAVALLETDLAPEPMLGALKAIERRAGRPEADPERWGPRVLDLDLLDLDGIVREGEDLALPHPRIAERAFVLVPLCEIAPHWRDPRTGRTATEMLAALDPDPSEVRLAGRFAPALEDPAA